MTNIFAKPQKTSKIYQITNEIFSAITHGIGLLLAIAGTVLLIIKAVHQHPMAKTLIAYLIYSCTLIFLYLCSTLFHSLYFTKAQHIFQILDHSSIFLLIAGTYTPFCMLAIPAPFNIVLLSTIWIITIGGIIYKIFNLGAHPIIDTSLYVIMGWLVILAMKPLHHSLGTTGILLLFFGGIAFTVGALLYTMRGIKYIHVIWHIFVMLGTTLMFFSVYLFL